MTDSQQKVLDWLEHQRKSSIAWFRPSDIKPEGYAGGASAIGKVLGSLVAEGAVNVDSADRGNGTRRLVYRAAFTNWKGLMESGGKPAKRKRA